MKPGTGKSTEHADRHQTGSGPGATNHPLTKSMVNPVPPNVKEASGHSGPPKEPPQAKARSGTGKAGGPAVVEARPSRTSSTFRAPRSGGGDSDLENGFTKVKM